MNRKIQFINLYLKLLNLRLKNAIKNVPDFILLIDINHKLPCFYIYIKMNVYIF